MPIRRTVLPTLMHHIAPDYGFAVAVALAEPPSLNAIDVMAGRSLRSRRMRIASVSTLMPTRRADDVLLDQICRCRLAIGVE
jgi:hypothetical protein